MNLYAKVAMSGIETKSSLAQGKIYTPFDELIRQTVDSKEVVVRENNLPESSIKVKSTRMAEKIKTNAFAQKSLKRQISQSS